MGVECKHEMIACQVWNNTVNLIYVTIHQWSHTCESFHVKRSNVVEVRARTDPDLTSLVIFYVISKILDREANWRRCPHGSVTYSHGMTHHVVCEHVELTK